MSRCLDLQEQATVRGEPYSLPGWETALGWFEGTGHRPPKVIWPHGSDEWGAPHALFAFLDQFFHFDHNVCASPQTAKCRQFWTKQDDGLKQTWRSGKVYWMNAPYSQAGRWARKAAEAAKGGAIVVGLFANRSSTAWYRDYVVPSAMVVQLQGRLLFRLSGSDRHTGQYVGGTVPVDPGDLASRGWSATDASLHADVGGVAPSA